MSKTRIRAIAIATVGFVFSAIISSRRIVNAANPKPLNADDILALVAGNALPQNIVHAISQDGLAFHPDNAFRAQLTAIDADPSIVSAVNSASVAPGAASLDQTEHDILQHYVNAAKKIKSKDYQGAYDELVAVAKSSIRDAGAGFVMGDVLRAEERYDGAAAVYLAVLNR